MSHPVKMTDDEKVTWFKTQISHVLRLKPIESEESLVLLVRDLRDSFKKLFARDVPGSFIRRLLSDFGVNREHSENVQRKRDWMHAQMDENKALRENKTQMRKAMHSQFKETTLSMVFDELWDDYHSNDDHPEPKIDVDIYGQQSLFE